MAELANFPFINQLDGTENGQFNCVPASICAGLQYLTGRSYSPDALKDYAYGPNWSDNGTSVHAFVSFVEQQGVKIYSASGTPEQLVQRAHQEIQASHPVVFTQQDDYAPAQYRDVWLHVCIWYKESTGSLTAMDPYGARELGYSDQIWASRLRASEIWIMEGQKKVISLKDVAGWFEQAPGNVWRCKRTGKAVGNAILDFYRSYGGTALCGLTYLGLPLTDERGIGNGRTIQRFERGVLIYDPAHTNDAPPGAGAVYIAKIYEGIGVDPGIAIQQGQIANLQQQLRQAQQPQTDPKHLQALQEIGRIVSSSLS